MSTLYRDYRPKNFAEVLGQNHIKITLQNEISANQVAQAFLFCGPRAVGKTTLARILAKAVNCLERQDGSYEPCNKCASCLGITQSKNLDVVEIDAASNTGVDNVRENIIAFSRLAPIGAKFKVFIIDEVHMLSLSAFNALLKIIEEPPAHVIFILCTTEVHKVPLTIVSRCERFDFKRISVSDIVKKLAAIATAEKIAVDRPVLEAVARKSGGHLRDAESLLGQIFSLGDKKVTLEQAELVIPHSNSHEAIDLLEYLSRKDAAKAVALINGLADSGLNLKNFTAEVISLLRKIMLGKLNPGLVENLGLDLGEALEMRLNQVAENLGWDQIFAATRRFLEAYSDNRNSFILQLPLELAVAELCLGADRPSWPPTGSDGFNPEGDRPKAAPAKTVSGSQGRIMKKEIRNDIAANNEKPASKAEKSAIGLDAAAVMDKWPEFLVRIKKYNHSLSFVLQNCQPQAVKDGCLGLVFKYKFHQDRVQDAVIKGIMERTLAEVFGSNLSFCSSVDENLEIRREEKAPEAAAEAVGTAAGSPAEPEKKPAGLLGDLLKAFGGEIIN